MLFLNFIYLLLLIRSVLSSKDWSSDMQPGKWNKYAKDRINKIINKKPNGNIAKNIILFLGDGFSFFIRITFFKNYLKNSKGMGITTVTAGRIRKGQLKNNNGEEEVTFMESLSNVALSKVSIKKRNLKNSVDFRKSTQ